MVDLANMSVTDINNKNLITGNYNKNFDNYR